MLPLSAVPYHCVILDQLKEAGNVPWQDSGIFDVVLGQYPDNTVEGHTDTG
jgi:hypothetical protein